MLLRYFINTSLCNDKAKKLSLVSLKAGSTQDISTVDSIVLNCIVLYCIVLYCIALYCIVFIYLFIVFVVFACLCVCLFSDALSTRLLTTIVFKRIHGLNYISHLEILSLTMMSTFVLNLIIFY